MRGSRLAVPVLVLALALSASAFASSGYRLYSAAWQHPPSGSIFTASAHGFAPKKALLSLYLDRKPCRSTWASEAKRFTRFKAGQSYFRNTRRAFTTQRVHGQFDKAWTAQAGTKAEVEYACAYLTSPNSRGRFAVTAAVASSHYTVTP